MTDTRPLAIQTEDLDAECAAWLAQRMRVIAHPADASPRFFELLAEAAALVVRTYTVVNRALLDRASNLRVVGRAGVGLDNIDVPACRARGIEVVHTPGANTRAVVEYVAALIADATRPRLMLDRAIPTERWNRLRKELVAKHELNELTLGIWGLGRVGSGVARYGRAMNMRVIAHDIDPVAASWDEPRRGGATLVDLDTLLRESDILSIHIDERSSNRNALNPERCARLKPEVLLLNTSRGFVIDTHALATFMLDHPGAQALLDVHEPEPFDATYPLLEIKNVHLAPHLASGTSTAKRNMSWVVRDVWRVCNGEKPEWPAAVR